MMKEEIAGAQWIGNFHHSSFILHNFQIGEVGAKVAAINRGEAIGLGAGVGGEEGGGAGGGELGFQRVHQGHQFVHFGHDSG